MIWNLKERQIYLGDGVYAEYSGRDVKLSTERQSITHEIFLEPEMVDLLYKWFHEQPGTTKGTQS